MCKKRNEVTSPNGATPPTVPCTCPFCKRELTVPDGITPEHHLAKNLLQILGEGQRNNRNELWGNDPGLCLCCGEETTHADLTQNKRSQYADVYICHECAAREEHGVTPLLEEWFIVKGILRF